MLCDASLKHLKLRTILMYLLKLTSDMELDGFKNLAFNYRYIRWVMLANTTRQRDGLNSKIKYKKVV